MPKFVQRSSKTQVTTQPSTGSLSFGNRDDRISGTTSDNKIDGGGGVDTAVYLGSANDFTSSSFAWSGSTLTVRGGTKNGTDQLTNVEFLEISGKKISVNGAIAKSDTFAATEGQSLSINALANDFSLKADAKLSYVRADQRGVAKIGDVVAKNDDGILTLGADGNLVFTASLKYKMLGQGDQGVATFNYTIWNGQYDAYGKPAYSTSAISINIAGSNNAALIMGVATGKLTEGPTGTVSGTLAVLDIDAGESRFQTPTSLKGEYGTFTFDARSGKWTYKLDQAKSQSLNEGVTTTDTLTVKSFDGTTKDIVVTLTGTQDKASITGTSTGGLTEDAVVTTASGKLAVTDVDAGENQFKIPVDSDLQGLYGKFSLTAAGDWAYTIDDTKADSLAAGQQVKETLTVWSKDGTTSQVIIVTVTGSADNTAAKIMGTFTGEVTEDGEMTVNGTVTVVDTDAGENALENDSVAGNYGTFTFKAGEWTYTLDAEKADRLTSKDVAEDRVMVTSKDGSASQEIVVKITGADDSTVTIEDSSKLPTQGGALKEVIYAGTNAMISTYTLPEGVETFTASGSGAVDLKDNAGNTDFVFGAGGGKIDLSAGGSDTVAIPAGTSSAMSVTGFGQDDLLKVPGAGAVKIVEITSGSAVLHMDTNGDNVADTTVRLEGEGLDGSKLLPNDFTIAFKDGGSTITFAPQNDGPTGSASTVLADGSEDTLYTISAADLLAGFSDSEGNTLSVSDLKATNGTLAETATGWTFTPAADYAGPVELTYSVVDGNGGSVAASQGFTVAATNDGPTGSASTVLADGSEDTPYTISAADLLAGFSDSEGNTLSVSDLKATNGTLAETATGWTFAPAADYAGPVELTYSVVDGNGGSVAASQGFTVAATNDGPTGSASTVLADGSEDTPYTISAADLLAGFSDSEGNTLSVSDLKATNGTLAETATGWTFAPAADYAGPVELTYSVVDGNGGSVAASQGFTVAATNDGPTGSASTVLADGSEDTPYTISAADLLAGFSDSEGNTLSVSDLKATNGTLAETATGWTFTPAADYSGPVELTYSVVDGNGGSVAASQGFTVAATNDTDPTDATDPVTTAPVATIGDASASEAAGSITFPVTLSAEATQDVTLTYEATIPGRAISFTSTGAASANLPAGYEGLRWTDIFAGGGDTALVGTAGGQFAALQAGGLSVTSLTVASDYLSQIGGQQTVTFQAIKNGAVVGTQTALLGNGGPASSSVTFGPEFSGIDAVRIDGSKDAFGNDAPVKIDNVALGGGGTITNTVTIPAGSSSGAITVPVTNDSAYEAAETISVRLTGTTGGATLGTDVTAVGTVTNDDPEPGSGPAGEPVPMVTILPNSLVYGEVKEGMGGYQEFEVTRDSRLSESLTVKFKSDVFGPGEVTFKPGEDRVHAFFPIPNDEIDQATNQPYEIKIAESPNYVLGADTSVTGILIDNDGGTANTAPTASVFDTYITEDDFAYYGGSYSLQAVAFDAEMTYPAKPTLALSGPQPENGTISFDSKLGALMFTPGDGYLATLHEGETASFTYKFTATDGEFTTAPLQGTVYIIGKGQPAGFVPEITIEGPSEVTEGDYATYTLTRTGSTDSYVSVPVTLSGTATDGADYSAYNAFFAWGSSTATLTVETYTDDTVEESGETIGVNVGPVNGYKVVGEGVVTQLIDKAPLEPGDPNAVPGIEVIQSGGSTNLIEGGPPDTISVKLLAQPTADVVVPVYSDWGLTLDKSWLTFTPANWDNPQVISVTADEDNWPEEAGTDQPWVSFDSAMSEDWRYDGTYPSRANIITNVSDNTGEPGGEEPGEEPGGNTAPIVPALTNGYNVEEDGPALGVGVMGEDAEGNALTYSVVTPPSKGTVTWNEATRQFMFDPAGAFEDLAEGQREDVTFTYVANDGTTDSNIGTMTVTVIGAADAAPEVPVDADQTLTATTGVKTYTGGTGEDTLEFASIAVTNGTNTINLGNGTITGTAWNGATLTDIENLTLTDVRGVLGQSLTVNGDAEANEITVGTTIRKVDINGGDGADTITFKGTGTPAQASVITAGTGNDTVTVNSIATIDDRVASGLSGDDTYNLNTDTGRQTLQFGANNGHDTVTSYNIAADVLNFVGVQASTVTVTESDGNTVFTINGNSTVTVQGVTGLEFGKNWTAEGTYTPPADETPVVENPVELAVIEATSAPGEVIEGGIASFRLTRTGGDLSKELTVNVDLNIGGAKSGSDFTPLTTVTFAAGSTTASLDIATLTDEVDEGLETIEFRIVEGTGYTVSAADGNVTDLVDPVVETPVDGEPALSTIAFVSPTTALTENSTLSWNAVEGAASYVLIGVEPDEPNFPPHTLGFAVAPNTSYAINGSDEFVGMVVHVVAKDASGQVIATSENTTNLIENVNDRPTGRPVISDNSPEVGQLLTISIGDLEDGDGMRVDRPDEYGYIWERSTDGFEWALVGTTDSYQVTQADTGYFIRGAARYTDRGETLETVYALVTSKVGDPNPNTPPVAFDDAATTEVGQAITIDVRENDFDPESDAISIASFAQPANGKAALEGGKLVYTPNASFVGTDTFEYTLNGGDTGKVTVTVTQPDAQPLTLLTVDNLDEYSVLSWSAVPGAVSYVLIGLEPDDPTAPPHELGFALAPATTFDIAGDDEFAGMAIHVEARTANGTVITRSVNETTAIVNINDQPIGNLSIDDMTPDVGQTLTLGYGTFADGDGYRDRGREDEFQWAWERSSNGTTWETITTGVSPEDGPYGMSYTVTQADHGFFLRGRAIYEDRAGDTIETVYSLSTSKIGATPTTGGGTDGETGETSGEPGDQPTVDFGAVTIKRTGESTTVTEGGNTDTFTVELADQPTANVTVQVSTGNSLYVDTYELVFTPDDWNDPRVITVGSDEDYVDEGEQSDVVSFYTISDDPRYADLMPADLPVTVIDGPGEPDPIPDVTVAYQGKPVTEGGEITFTFHRSEGTKDLPIDVGITGLDPSDITAIKWNGVTEGSAGFVKGFRGSASLATMTVVLADDADVEGEETVDVTVLPSQTYLWGDPSVATATVLDNDTAPVPVNTAPAVSDKTLDLTEDNLIGSVAPVVTDAEGDATMIQVVGVLPEYVRFDVEQQRFLFEGDAAAFDAMNDGDERSFTVNYVATDGDMESAPGAVTFKVAGITDVVTPPPVMNDVEPALVADTNNFDDGGVNGTTLAAGIGTVNGETINDGAGLLSSINGAGGADTIYGRDGADTIVGGTGSDTVYGGTGDDTINGDMGGATTATANPNFGTHTGDFLYGGDGDDNILGVIGDDTINGGHGADTMDGGAGSDTYVFNDIFDRGDTLGFQGVDVLNFRNFDFDPNAEGRQGAVNGLQIKNEAPVSGAMLEDTFYYDASTGMLSLNTGTDGKADFTVKLTQPVQQSGFPLSLVGDDLLLS